METSFESSNHKRGSGLFTVQKFHLRQPLVLINIGCRLIAQKITLNKCIIMIVNMIIYYSQFVGYPLCSLFKTQNYLNCTSLKYG